MPCPNTGETIRRTKSVYFPRTQFSRKQVLAIKSELDHKFKTGDFDPWRDVVDLSDLQKSDTNLSKIVDEYIASKQRYDWRQETARRYRMFFVGWFKHVGESTQLHRITQDMVNDYINRSKLAYESRKTYRRALVTFFTWCTDNHYSHNIDVKELRIAHGADMQEQTIRYLSASDIERLASGIARKICHNVRMGYTSNDDPFLVIDFINWQRMTGMRVSETLSLTAANINMVTWELSIGDKSFVTKSRKRQTLPIGEIARLQHIARRRIRRAGGGTLFKFTDPKRLSKKFKRYVRRYLPERDDICVHDLRHTCAIELLRGGVGIYQVSRWMRHQSVATTQRYADVLASDLAAQVGKVFG
jgi:integrase